MSLTEKDPTMPSHRGNLLFDSISQNTGDIAIGLASAQILKDHGIPSQIVDPFRMALPQPLVIGGGDLIRGKGDPFYDLFRRTGEHILNAAGVWSNADDLGYLADYAFVSARSEMEVEILRKWVPKAEVVPCATTVLRSEHFTIPGLEAGEPVVGIQLVPHSMRLIEDLVPIINAIPYKKVFIPFTHYNADASFMNALPFDRTNSIFLAELNPLELHSVVSQMNQVVASSLHISIFAYSQNVPFVSIHQEKIQNYFQDRGLKEHVVGTGHELRLMLDCLAAEDLDFSTAIAADRAKVEFAFDRYIEILTGAKNSEARADFLKPVDSTSKSSLKRSQSADIVMDRDITVGVLESRRLAALMHDELQAAELKQLQAEKIHLNAELENLRAERRLQNAELQALRRRLDQRLKRLIRHPIRTLGERISARRAR